MKKIKLKISLETDFNSKNIKNYIKENLSKDFLTNITCKDYENININLNSNTSKNDFVFVISHLEKTFIQYYNFNNSVEVNEKKLNNEIDAFSKRVIQFSKNNKQVFLFLWPLEINDNYMGNLNFKKGHKSWLINYINLKVSERLSFEKNLHLIDTNFLVLRKEAAIKIYDEKTKYLTNNYYSLDMIGLLSNHINRNLYLKI